MLFTVTLIGFYFIGLVITIAGQNIRRTVFRDGRTAGEDIFAVAWPVTVPFWVIIYTIDGFLGLAELAAPPIEEFVKRIRRKLQKKSR